MSSDYAKGLRQKIEFAKHPGRHPSICLTLPGATQIAEHIENLERLLGYAVTSKRTGFSIPDHWLPAAQKALRYDQPNDIEGRVPSRQGDGALSCVQPLEANPCKS